MLVALSVSSPALASNLQTRFYDVKPYPERNLAHIVVVNERKSDESPMKPDRKAVTKVLKTVETQTDVIGAGAKVCDCDKGGNREPPDITFSSSTSLNRKNSYSECINTSTMMLKNSNTSIVSDCSDNIEIIFQKPTPEIIL
jgi:hypothetical protein